MKINNLYVGQELIPHPKSGKAKENITKKLKRYFNWITKGRKITITEIYSTPKEKVDNRGKSEGSRGNNYKYQEDMSILIEDYLAISEKEEFKIAINTLAYNGNIVSEVYKEAMIFGKQKRYSIGIKIIPSWVQIISS